MESKIKTSTRWTCQTVVGNDHSCVTPKRLFRSDSDVNRPHGNLLRLRRRGHQELGKMHGDPVPSESWVDLIRKELLSIDAKLMEKNEKTH